MTKRETVALPVGYLGVNMEFATHDRTPSSRDREIIRVYFADDRMGITAALRRAFNAAANDRSTHDFERLLSELN